MGLAGENPVSKVKAPRCPKLLKPFLEEEDFRKPLALCDSSAFPGSRRAAMLYLLVTTGLRRRELYLLRLDDLDWDGGRILVRNGKGQKSRVVPFLPEARNAVRSHLGHRVGSDSSLTPWRCRRKRRTWTSSGPRTSGLMGAGIARVERGEVAWRESGVGLCRLFRRAWLERALWFLGLAPGGDGRRRRPALVAAMMGLGRVSQRVSGVIEWVGIAVLWVGCGEF